MKELKQTPAGSLALLPPNVSASIRQFSAFFRVLRSPVSIRGKKRARAT
jgi:hypothetical protein